MGATITLKLSPKDFDLLRECVKLRDAQLRAQYADSNDLQVRDDVARKLGAIEDLARKLA
jgi:hypothetical protein